MDLRANIRATSNADMGAIIFAPIVAAAKRARSQINAELSRISVSFDDDSIGGYRDPARRRVSSERRASDDVKRIAKEEAAFKRELDKADAARFRERVREQQKVERDAARQSALEARRNQHIADESALRMSRGAVRGVSGLVHRGVGVAADIARGMGVDFSIGRAMATRVEAEKIATDVANSAYMPGAEGPNGQRQDPRALMAQAAEIGTATGNDPTKILEGIQKFVGKTGDLQTARETIQQLAVLSRATGTSMEDMVSAAGDVSTAFGDAPNKAQRIQQVMAAIAGQGKLGAVEIRDLSSQMAKLAANAGRFEGDVGQNIALLGAFAQEARQRGGATSATMASTSVASLMNTFATPAREAAFRALTKSAGHEKSFFTKSGMIRSPEEILMDTLRASKGDINKFKSVFANVQGARAVEGFATIYRQAGGGTAGEAAVKAEMDRLKQSAMAGGEIQDSFNNSMKTTEAQVTVLKNKLSKELGDTAEKIAPQLMRLSDAAMFVVEGLGKLAGWAIDNPLKAAFAGLGLSITKSIAEEVMRAGIERLTGRAAGGVAVSGAANTYGAGRLPTQSGFLSGVQGQSGMQTAMNVAGAALAITATAVTIESVGELVIDKLANTNANAQKSVISDLIQSGNTKEALRVAEQQYNESVAAGAPSPEAVANLEKARGAVRNQIETVQTTVTNAEGQVREGNVAYLADAVKAAFQSMTGQGPGIQGFEKNNEAVAHLAELRAEIQGLKAALTGSTLRVEVANMPEGGPGGAPTAPTAGRDGY